MNKTCAIWMLAAVATSASYADESTGGAAGGKAPFLAKKNIPTIVAIGLGSATALAVGVSGSSDHHNTTSTATTTASSTH